MSDAIKALLSLLVPLAVTFFILPRFAHMATYIGLVDIPNRRKLHRMPKPLVGGLAMSLGVAFGCLLFIPLNFIKGYAGGGLRGYYAGSVLLVVIGFFDDFKEVHHRLKFFAQIIAAILIVLFSRVSLVTFGDLLSFGSINFPLLAIPMTILGTVGVINALNMIDGVDGLAGGISLVAFSAFAVLSYIDGHVVTLLLCLALCGAIIAFLWYNWNPAKLFMGDAGSLFLGFTASFVSIVLTQEQGSIVRPVAPLLVLAVPITDTLTVMIKRMIRGKSPFYADRTHLHHVLLKFGFTKRQTTSIIIAMSSAFSLLALAGTVFEFPEYSLFMIFLAYFFAYFLSSFFVKRALRNHRTRKVRRSSAIA